MFVQGLSADDWSAILAECRCRTRGLLDHVQSTDIVQIGLRRGLRFRHMANLYKVAKKDSRRAGRVLADAFLQDPFWHKVLENAGFTQMSAFFEGSVRFCRKYGQMYATSEHLEGIIGWVPDDHADMTAWRMIRSGSAISGMRMGVRLGARLGRMMGPVFGPLEAERKRNMRGISHIYLIIIGVASELQGQGFGGRLLRSLIAESERVGLPIYVETTTERNVRMYERLGFRQLSRTVLPIIDLPQWALIRDMES